MLAFVAVTNRWVSWADAVGRYHDGDPISYRAIAAAAPGLLHRRIAEWHAERFIPNYLVGCVAKLLHAGLTPTYRVACVVLAVVICLVLADVLVRLHVSRATAAVCLAVFILNPYGLRYFFFGVGRVADLMFILGALIAARGLVLRAPVSLLAGLLLATMARQTALPAALVASVVIVSDPAWRARLGATRGAFAGAVIALPVACYVVIRIVAAPFSGPAPSLHAMTLLGSGNLHALLDHFARSAISLLAVTALLAASWWRLRDRGIRTQASIDAATDGIDRAGGYACLLVGAAIALQPVILNPSWAQDSEPRLAVLGMAPLVLALAVLMRGLALDGAARLGLATAAVLVGLLAIGSFHHIFTVVGPASKGETVALQCTIAIAAGALLLWSSRRAPEPG
ncbi:MAG: hypothetical protein ACJ76X_07065 [Solirubrobacteraceae bacterium]